MTEGNVLNSRDIAGVPFRMAPRNIVNDQPNMRETWFTTWEYGKIHGFGNGLQGYFKVNEDGSRTFMTTKRFGGKDWKEDDYRNYKYDDGSYFKKHFVGLVQFAEPITLAQQYNPETKQRENLTVDSCWVPFTSSQYEKICDEYEDRRTNIHDYIVLKFDKNASPASMYTFKFAQEGEPFSADELAEGESVAGSNFALTPEEITALQEVNGAETTVDTVVEFLTSHEATKDKIDSERAAVVANQVLKNGVVTIKA